MWRIEKKLFGYIKAYKSWINIGNVEDLIKKTWEDSTLKLGFNKFSFRAESEPRFCNNVYVERDFSDRA
jgi:hypothetical protein